MLAARFTKIKVHNKNNTYIDTISIYNGEYVYFNKHNLRKYVDDNIYGYTSIFEIPTTVTCEGVNYDFDEYVYKHFIFNNRIFTISMIQINGKYCFIVAEYNTISGANELCYKSNDTYSGTLHIYNFNIIVKGDKCFGSFSINSYGSYFVLMISGSNVSLIGDTIRNDTNDYNNNNIVSSLYIEYTMYIVHSSVNKIMYKTVSFNDSNEIQISEALQSSISASNSYQLFVACGKCPVMLSVKSGYLLIDNLKDINTKSEVEQININETGSVNLTQTGKDFSWSVIDKYIIIKFKDTNSNYNHLVLQYEEYDV